MNKKRTRILIMLLSTVCLILVGVIIFQSFSIHKNSNPKNEKIEQKDNYDKIVSNFKEISNDELQSLDKNKQNYYLYVGEKDCRYCQDIVPRLRDISNKNEMKIYYIDSSKKENESILKNLDIKFVPYIASASFSNGEKESHIYDERYMYLPAFFNYESKLEIGDDNTEKEFLKTITKYNLSVESRFNSLNERLTVIEKEYLDDEIFIQGITKEIDNTLLYINKQLTSQKHFYEQDKINTKRYEPFFKEQEVYINNIEKYLTEFKNNLNSYDKIIDIRDDFYENNSFDSYSLLNNIAHEIKYDNYFEDYQEMTQKSYENYV